MTFVEFKSWLLALDAMRDGRPPDLAQWWELKARLEAVDHAVLPAATSAGSQPTSAPPRTSPAPEPTADTAVEDMEPMLDLDPEPCDFRALSRAKDGGLSAHAVDVLKGRH